MKRVLLIKYGEIALRGKNRHIYEKGLMSEIASRLGANYSLTREQGGILLEDISGDIDYDAVVETVLNVPGIFGVCRAVQADDMAIENLCALALSFMEAKCAGETTFKVTARRSDKRYPMTSPEISARVGGFILDRMQGLAVDLHNPQIIVNIELRNKAYVFSGVEKGIGGLPSGSSGKGMLLLSGGIDSPVAGFLGIKRGVGLEAVYFHSPPYTSQRAKLKVCDLAERLALFAGGMDLYVVPFTETQLYLNERMPQDKLTVFLKRAMLKTAEIIALRNKCQCLITGDSIGQVASQTLAAIQATNSAASLPVIRPLAGLDKQEITDIAEKIGTYEISIRPFEDCCTVFVARHPDLRPKQSIIENMERRAEELPGLLAKAAADAELIKFT